ncbi:GTPase Era [Parvicella tangerina]|uniref:GTPase Era n=1 Tax=Parvicella tangerina TaxID=2829795 RepID=A0A916JMK0_9FLAO|nr:GTPase Era [Parvicella tangerina]CAG5079651.1 GTPase Era [Parvicella tangerina]
MHKAGFVNIIGSPNVGKSTLMNRLVGERLSIITSKKQTTRHRIMGIVNEEDYQVVFSDTPGVLDPSYKLHENMMSFVNTAITDADVILLVTDIFEKQTAHQETLEKIQKHSAPVLVLVNKVDLSKDEDRLLKTIENWKQLIPRAEILPISALHGFSTDFIFPKIVELLPESPPFFAKDELTDKPMRFFVSEIIREKIFENYAKEVPYSTQVEVEYYKEKPNIVEIRAIIYVSRSSQKPIIIGQQGAKIKRVGTQARKDLEAFIGSKVFLDLYVKVDKDWRDKEAELRKFGYQ